MVHQEENVSRPVKLIKRGSGLDLSYIEIAKFPDDSAEMKKNTLIITNL